MYDTLRTEINKIMELQQTVRELQTDIRVKQCELMPEIADKFPDCITVNWRRLNHRAG